MAPPVIDEPDPSDLAEPITIDEPDPADLAEPVVASSLDEPDPSDLASPPPARGVMADVPTIGGVPLPDSMLPMTPAAAAEASRAAPVQATPEQRQASFQETAAKTADLRRRIEIAERAGNKEGAQQLIQDLEAVAPGTVARQEKQNAQLRTLTKMGIGGAVAGPAALLTSTIAAPANEAIMSREIDADLPPSDSLAQYWKYGAQSFRSQVKMVAKKPETVDDWLKFQESAAKLKVAEEKLVPGEGFVRKGLQGLANSAPAMIDTLVQSGGFAPASFKQWADQGTAMILSDALRGKDVRSMSKEQLDEFYYMARGAGALYAGVEFGQSPLALTKALGFDVGGNIAGKVIKMAAENPVFKRKLVQIGMRFAGRTAAEIGEEGLQQPITDLTTDAIKTMAENPDKGKVAATWDNLAAKWWDYTKGSAEAMKQAIIPAAGMILGGKVVETPFRLAAAQEAKKKAAAPGPQPGPEDAEPVRDIEKFKQEWREAELPEDVITKLADNYAKGDKAGEDAIIAEYEASQAAAAREAAKTPATATEEAPTPTQGLAPEGGKATQAGPVAANVEAAAEQVEPAPTEAQKAAGNYAKGHVTIQGLPVTIETAKGQERAGKDASGKPWKVTMPGHYGYVKGTKSSDGEQVDVHVGPNPDSEQVFVVDQIDPETGKHDEPKAILGTKTEAEARDLYVRGFSDGKGEQRIGAISAMPMPAFKAWLDSGDTKKPVAYKEKADADTVKSAVAQTGERPTGPAAQVAEGKPRGVRPTAGEIAPETGPVAQEPTVQPKKVTTQEKPSERHEENAEEVRQRVQADADARNARRPQLPEGRQAADEAPEPRQPDVLSRQAQPAATPTSTAGGVAGPSIKRTARQVDDEVLDNLMDADQGDEQTKGAFAKAGYVEVDGFMVHPNVDPEFVRQLKPSTKQKMREKGIFYIGSEEAATAAGRVAAIQHGKRKLRGVDAKAISSRDNNIVVLHEIGHHVWQEELTDEQRAEWNTRDRVTDHGKRVEAGTSGHDYAEGSAAEEDFAQAYAENDGDLNKTLSPESVASQEKEDVKSIPSTRADETREIYPQEFEDRIAAGQNPSAEAEAIPDAPIVDEKRLNAAKAAAINGSKAFALQQRAYRGLVYNLARMAAKTADMFYGAGSVTYYLHSLGILKPGHVVSEYEPLRAIMAKQMAGPDFKQVASETKKLVKEITGIMEAALDVAARSTTGDQLIEEFSKMLAAMPDPSPATADIRKKHEAYIVARFTDSTARWPEKFIKDHGTLPGNKDVVKAWSDRAVVYATRFWAELKAPEYLAPGQDLDGLRKKQKKYQTLLEQHPELHLMDDLTTKDARQQWLYDQMRKNEPAQIALRDTPETAAFNIAIQWLVGSNSAIGVMPGDIAGLAPMFGMVQGGSEFTDSEIDSVIARNHDALKDAKVMQANSWEEIPKLADENPGILIIADPSYFAEDGVATRNYGSSTDIQTPDDLMRLVDKYLIPAWQKGARIILTNTYEENTVKRLQERGFNVASFTRRDGSRELAAYNASPTSGQLLPARPEARWLKTERARSGKSFEFKPGNRPDATGGARGIQASKKRVARGVAEEAGPRGGVAYPIAGDEVDGRTVRDEIPNLSSISASLDQYEILSGVREVPMSEFDLSGEHYSVEGNKRISELANAISESGEITPLIVVVDKDGPYILEGATRADALFRLKAKSFPALVVIDKSDIQFSKRRKTPRTTEKVKARAALIEGPVDFALSDYPIPYLPRRAKDRTGGTRDPVNTVMSTLRYYAREGTMEQKRIARELLDRWTTESSRSPDEWYEEMSGSNPAVAGTDLGDFMANIVGPEVERIMEGRTLTPSDQFMDKEAEGEAEEAYRAAVEGMEAGSATPDVFKQAPALAEIGTTSEKPYRIVYPEGTVEAYKDADGWHVRTNRLLPFRRVDGTKAGRAMAASLDARLAAAKGETDERSTEGVETRRGRSTAVMHASRPIDSRQPEADTSIGKTTENLGRSQRDAVADDGIPEDGTAQISGPANAPQVETVVDANTAERQSPARRGKRDAGIGNKNKPEAGYERAQRDIARTEEALSIATEHAEENLAALKDAYARFDSRYSRLTVYTPAADDVQWGYAAEFSRILGQELLPVSGLWTNGIRAPKLPGVSVVDAKNDFPIIVTTAHEISHGFDKQYDTGTNDPLTNPALALRKALDAQIGPEQIEGYVNGPGINWRPKWNSTAGNPIGRKLLEQEIRVEMRADFMGEAITQEKFWVKLFDISKKAFDLFSRFVNDIIDRVSVSPRLSVLPYFRDVEAAMDAAAAFYKHVIETKAEREAAASSDLPFSAKREPNLFLQAKALEAQPPEGQDQHRFNKHVIEHKDIAPEVRERVAAHYYEVKPKKVTSDNAAAWLMKQGDTARAEAALFNKATDIPADERIAAATILHAKYADLAADESLSKEERDAALDQMIAMGNWIDNHFMQYGQAINQAKLHYHDLSTLRGSVANLQWTRRKANAAELQEVAPLAEAIAEVAEIERVQVEKQAEAIHEDMVAKAIYDEVVKRYRALEEVNQRLEMRTTSKWLKAHGDIIADPVRRNAPELAEANKKIDKEAEDALAILREDMIGIQASEKREALPGDDIIPEPKRTALIKLTVKQIRENGMADILTFTKWMKDTFGTAYEGKEISSIWHSAVNQYSETIAPYLTGPAKAKHAKAKESIKKDQDLQMDLPAQPSPFLGFSSEELAKYRKTELQGIIDQTRLRPTGTTQPTPEEAQMDLAARPDAPQGDIFPKELFLKAKAQDVIDMSKLSANAKAVFLAATTPDTTMAELYAQAGVPTEGVPYTSIIDAKLADLLTGPVMEKAIREHLRTWNESLARLAMQDASAGQAIAGSLAKQLTATFGLTPYKASILEQAIRKKVVRMTDAARQKELKRILSKKPDVKPRTRKQKQALDRVVSLNNLGAFDQQQIHDAILRELGILKPITADEMTQLKKNADAVKNAPEGFQQRDAVIDARHYISKLAGPNWYRLGMGVIYNNLLFNYRTDQRNFISNLSMATSSLISNIAADPKTAPARIAGYIQGTVPGLLEASAAMRGMSVVRMEGKLELPGGTRFRDLPGKAGKLLAPIDIGNISAMKLVAGDMLLFKPAEYAHMEAMVLNELLQEGISYGQAVKQAREKLYGTKAERMARRQQAEREIAARPGKFTRLGRRIDVSRRAEELRLQSLPQDQLAQARMLAAIDTFNFKSEGILGHISQWLSAFGENKDIALPARFAVRNLVLFTNIIANVSNFAWAGLPVLGKVQLTGRFGLRTYKSDYDRVVHHRLMQMNALAVVGILLADLAASGFFDDDEDEKKKKQKDPWFAIYGLGPDDKATRELMRAQGWKPFTIKVGDRYIQYQLITPLAGALTVLGSIRDAQRFDLIKDEKTWQAYASYGAVSLAQSMLNMSFLSTTADLLSAISEPSKDLAIKSINKFLSSIPGRLVPAASLQREVAYQLDPRQFEAKGILENLMRDIPFASKHLEPSVNILGDEVIRDRSVLITKAKPDPVYRLLADNDAVPSYPGKATRIEVPAERADPDGTTKMTPDEYHAYVKISGQLIKRQVTEELSDLRAMSAKEVQDRVEKITKDARDQAKAAIEQAAQDPSYDPESVLK